MSSSQPRWRTLSRLCLLLAVVLMAVNLAIRAGAAFGASRGHKPKPGIWLSGPLTNLLFDTPYTYHVTVISAKSYKHGYVSVGVPFCVVQKEINLTADQAWRGNFTVTFLSTNESIRGIGVELVSPITSKGAAVLYHKTYPVALVPGRVPKPTPTEDVCPNPLFGS
jgi:hypothetical protein